MESSSTTFPDMTELERMLESARAGTRDAQNTLIELAKGNRDSNELSRQLNRVANCEGAFEALARAHRALRHGETAAREVLVRRLLVGADDAGSGRGNDTKRAWFDGFRSQVYTLLDM